MTLDLSELGSLPISAHVLRTAKTPIYEALVDETKLDPAADRGRALPLPSFADMVVSS